MPHKNLLTNMYHAKRASRPGRCPLLAFTLVELLVVIGILGVLTGLVVRGLGQVEGASRDAQCKNTHRETAMTALVYVGDKHEYLPASYLGPLKKYSPPRFIGCLNIKRLDFYYNGWGSGGRFNDPSLGLVDGKTSEGLPEGRVMAPDDMLMFLDYMDLSAPPRMRNDEAFTSPDFPHPGAINVSYCDGHVDSLRQSELMVLPDTLKIRYNSDHAVHADTW